MNLFTPSTTDSSEPPTLAEAIKNLHSKVINLTTNQEFARLPPARGKMALRFSSTPQRVHRKTHDREKERIPPKIRPLIRKVLIGESPWPLYLWGPPQYGKTSASLFICDLVNGSYFWDFQTICTIYAGIKRGEPTVLAFRGAVTPEGWREPERILRFNLMGFLNHVRYCPLLVIDEIGLREQPTACQYECLIKILDERVGMPLIVTSNISPAEIEFSYDERIKSRIAQGTSVHFNERFVK